MSKKKSKTNRQQREIESNNNFIDRFFTYNTIIPFILLAIAIIARVSWVHSQSSIDLEKLQEIHYRFGQGMNIDANRQR